MKQFCLKTLLGISFFAFINIFLPSSVLLVNAEIDYISQNTDLIYVDHSASGNNDGSSWENAFESLQDAFDEASSNSEIWVAKGVYYPDEGDHQTNNRRTESFRLEKNVKLFGGFSGTEINRNQRDWEQNITVLSGDLDKNDNTDTNGIVLTVNDIVGGNAYHVVTGYEDMQNVVIDGFFITAGYADDINTEYGRGGGMYIANQNDYTPSLSNIHFQGNFARHYGGGLYNQGCHPDFEFLTFVHNQADTSGGGAYSKTCDYYDFPDIDQPSFQNVNFVSNTAPSGGGFYNIVSSPKLEDVVFDSNQANNGAGLYHSGGNPQLNNVVFRENTSNAGGGGMVIAGNSSPLITNSVFEGNIAIDGDGGGMINSGHLTLDGVSFIDNEGFYGGGIFNAGDCGLTSNEVTFSGNQAVLGGGMYNDCDITLSNLRFNNNSAAGGGGIYNGFGIVFTATNITLNNNNASQNGGGIYNGNVDFDISDVLLIGNSAGINGGGIYFKKDSHYAYGENYLYNSKFLGNTAQTGGGIFTDDLEFEIINTLFSGNSASYQGGGIYNNYNESILTLTNVDLVNNGAESGGGIYNKHLVFVRNSIFWENSASSTGDQIYSFTSSDIVEISNTNVQGSGGSGLNWDSNIGVDLGGNVDTEPLFVNIDGHDDIPGTVDDNLNLEEGSPMVDAGINSALPNFITRDIIGFPRFWDTELVLDTGQGTPPIVDIGAYEYFDGELVFLPVIVNR